MPRHALMEEEDEARIADRGCARARYWRHRRGAVAAAGACRPRRNRAFRLDGGRAADLSAAAAAARDPVETAAAAARRGAAATAAGGAGGDRLCVEARPLGLDRRALRLGAGALYREPADNGAMDPRPLGAPRQRLGV